MKMVLMMLVAFTAFGAYAISEEQGGKVWVFNSDGGKSCEPASAVTLDSAKESLVKAGVTVFDSRKETDGLMHAQVCGIDTGNRNAYLINPQDLKKVYELGFKLSEKK